MKLRLLLFEDCDRSCEGCCNKDWDLKALPVCDDYSPYDEILLTGGEPLLKPKLVDKVISDIKNSSSSKIYIYTAKLDNMVAVTWLLDRVDGLCVTLHKQSDVFAWHRFAENLYSEYWGKSLRLNVFKGVDLSELYIPDQWEVKKDIEWIKDCPLPEDEVFMKLKALQGDKG
jgi:hypothetical protein